MTTMTTMATMTTAGPLPIRVLVAHSLPVVQRALTILIDEEPDIDVVGECCLPHDAAAVARVVGPDVAVIGLGDEVSRWCTACSDVATLGSKVLVLVDEADPSVLALAARAQVSGFIATPTDGLASVIAAIRTVARGEAWVPRRLVAPLLAALVGDRRQDDDATARFARLSRREREVLMLLVEGHDQHDIASRLVVSPHTARTHIQRVLEKLEVHSRLEAAALTLHHGFLERFGERV